MTITSALHPSDAIALPGPGGTITPRPAAAHDSDSGIASAGDAAVRAAIDEHITRAVERLGRRSRAGVVDVHEQFSVPVSIAATSALVGLDDDLLHAVHTTDITGAWAAGLAWAVAELVDRRAHRPRDHDLTSALLRAHGDLGPEGRARLTGTIQCVAVAACATAVDVTDQTVAAALDGSARRDGLRDDHVSWTRVRDLAAGPAGDCEPAHDAPHTCRTHSLLAATCAVLISQRAPLLLLDTFPDMVPAGPSFPARPAGNDDGHLMVRLTGHTAP